MKENFFRLKKILSLATVISFIVTNHFGSAYAASAGFIAHDTDGTEQSPSDLPQNFSKISIPAGMGKIQELYQAKGPETRDAHAPVVILIQDAHAIAEAQRNIQKLITYFQGQYGVNLIALEGAASELDPQMFKSFPDQEILKKTLDDYMERGEITGSTAAAIFSNPNLQPEGGKMARASSQAVFQGIEDWTLYKKGLGLYQKAMIQEEKIQSAIHAEKAPLQKKKETVYSKELLNLDNALQAFNANRLDLIDMLKKLAEIQPPEKGTELALLHEEAGRDQKHQALQDLEVKKIGLEIKKALEFSAAEKADKVSLNEKWQEFQTSRISAQDFAVFLESLAAKASLPLQISARLSRSMNNQKRMRDIEGTRLFGDFEKYAQSVKRSLFRNEEEKKLDRISHRLELIERMSRLELSREDWNELKELPLDPSYKEFLKPHFSFYKNVEARDEVFYKNVMTLMNEHEAKISLLVAGGFHTESMIRRFKEGGISYLLLTPQINSIPENSHYREHMRGDVSWKDYYEVEDGKVNLYKAFVRGARDRLLGISPQTVSGTLLKAWRDQIIRDLARQEKITKVQDYTFFLDELMRGSNSPVQNLNPRWYAKVEKLIQAMRDLDAQKQWTEKNILNLISGTGGSALGTSPATHADLTYSDIAAGSILDVRYFRGVIKGWDGASLREQRRSEVRSKADEEKRRIAQWAVQSLVHMKGLVEEKTPEFEQFKEKITGIFKRLLHAGGIEDADTFELLMVAEPEPNALIAVDAQKVIITQGLIKEMERYVQKRKKPITEDFIAFILAHELNHYRLRVPKPPEPILKEEGVPGEEVPDEDKEAFENIRENSFAHILGYREEYLADNHAIRLMDQAGYNPLEAVRAAEFIKFIQDKEWEDRLAEVDISVRSHPDREIEMLEDIRKDKLRRNFIPSIIDTHPRTQNRIQSLYLLTINRLFKNEDKPPVPIEIPHFESSYGKREMFWNELMVNLADHQIAKFVKQAQTTAQMEDLALLYFLMILAGSTSLYWHWSYDMADLIDQDKKPGLIFIAESYFSLPYVHLASWYLRRHLGAFKTRLTKDVPDYVREEDSDIFKSFSSEAGEYGELDEYNDWSQNISAEENNLAELEKEKSEMTALEFSEKKWEFEGRKKEIQEAIDSFKIIQRFFDTRLHRTVYELLRQRSHIYRILFTPWGRWNDESHLKELVTDDILTMPFRHPPYQKLLARGRKLFERDYPKVKGIRRDMLLWLLFHSYYPSPAGYQLMQGIEKKLKNPNDLLFALRHLPAKQYEDERLRRAFTGYSGFAYLDMLAHYFIPRVYLSLNENGAFQSAGQMMDFLETLSNELVYLKSAVRSNVSADSKQGFLSRTSLYQDLFDELLQVSLTKLKTRQDFEALAQFWSKARGIPQEAMNEEKLAQAIQNAGILGEDFEKDVALISALIRGTARTNHLAEVLFNVYPKTKENILKIIFLIADSRDFALEIRQFLLSGSQWQSLSLLDKFKRLQELRLILPEENYLEIFEAHKSQVKPAQFLEAVQTMDSFPKGHLQYTELQKSKRELGVRMISALRKRKGWQEGSDEHFRIIAMTVPDSEEKMELLEAMVKKAGGRLEHYQRAVAAMAIGRHKEERFAQIKTVPGAVTIAEEFRKRKRDPAYHRTHLNELKEPKEMEKESLSPLFKRKLALGEKGWELAGASPGFKSKPLVEKLKIVESLFPDPSPVREDLLKALQAEPRSELRTRSGSDYLNEQMHLLRLASDPVWRVQLGAETMHNLRNNRPELFESFERHRDLILKLFPDFSLERDRQLSRLIDSHDSSFHQTQSVNGYFLEGNEEYTTEEAVVFGMAGMETFRDYMHVTPPSEKVELLLWLLDLQVKPQVVDVMEQSIGYKALSIKEGMKNAGPDENRIFLQEILLGQNGIFSDGSESDMQYLLDRIFLLVFPDELKLNADARTRLKALFDGLFQFSTPKRRADLMIALANSKNERLSLPQTIRVFLQAYGTVGIKAGQYLAVRTSLLPQEIRDELLKLTDRADPFLKQRAYEMVQVEFGAENPEEIFPRIGRRLSTASFKQVYEGAVRDETQPGGVRPVTLKVIRPAAKKEVTADLDTFVNLIRFISENAETFGFSLPQDMGEEIRRRTLEEMDFEKERQKQERMRLDLEKRWGLAAEGNLVRNDSGYTVRVPEVRAEYTRKTIFVDDLVRGLPLTRQKEVREKHDLSALSQTIVKEFLDQIFLDGFYHGDPHPGNMLVSEDKTLSLIDFGITGSLSPKNRDRLFDLLQRVMKKDKEGLVNLALEFYAEMEPAVRPEISLDTIETVISEILAQNFQPASLGKSVYDVLDRLNRAGIRLPSEFYTLIGTLTAMDYWFSQIHPFQLAFFLLGLLGKYQGAHEASKAKQPVERISPERLEEIRLELSQAKNGAKPQKKKQTKSAGRSIGQIEEIWKISKVERGARFRFKGKEDEIWKLTYDMAPRSGGVMTLERKTGKAGAQNADVFEPRARFIVNSWVKPRLPLFPNDGTEFSEERGEGDFEKYLDSMVSDEHPWAVKIAGKVSRKWGPIKTLHVLFSKFQPYDEQVLYEKYREGEKVFRNYLFKRLGIPKKAVEELVQGIKEEIGEGRIELKEIELTEGNIQQLQILEDNEKWVDFAALRLSKGLSSPRSEIRSSAFGEEDHSASRIARLKSDLPMTGIGGEPYTNEDVTAFISGLDKIDIQGGGFLGVGSFHNLDIALDRGASAIVLVDYAPEVVERNLKLLGFIERAENPAQLRLMIEKEGWQDDLEAIRTAESSQRSRIGASLGRTPLLWYDDEDYFKRLKQLMREGRIAVAYADLAQPESMKPVGEFFIQTGIPLRLINLSNVEMHIERGVGIKGLANLGDALKAAGANADTLVTAAMPFRYVVNFVQRYKRREMIFIPRVVPLGMNYRDEANYSAGWLNILRTMGDIEEGRLLTKDLDSRQPMGSIVRGYLAQIESRAQKPPLLTMPEKSGEQARAELRLAGQPSTARDVRPSASRSELRIEAVDFKTATEEQIRERVESAGVKKGKQKLIIAHLKAAQKTVLTSQDLRKRLSSHNVLGNSPAVTTLLSLFSFLSFKPEAEDREIPLTEKMGIKLDQIVSGISDPQDRATAQKFVNVFKQNPEIDDTLLTENQNYALAEVILMMDGRLKGRVSAEFLEHYPLSIIRPVLIHEGTHAEDYLSFQALNLAVREFFEVMKRHFHEIQEANPLEKYRNRDILQALMRAVVTYIENEWFAYQKGDQALLREIQQGGGFEVFERSLPKQVGGVFSDLKQRLDDNMLPDPLKTKIWILKSLVDADWMKRKNQGVYHLVNSLLMSAYEHLGQNVLDIIPHSSRPAKPFVIKDYGTMVYWIEEKSQRLGVYDWLKETKESLRSELHLARQPSTAPRVLPSEARSELRLNPSDSITPSASRPTDANAEVREAAREVIEVLREMKSRLPLSDVRTIAAAGAKAFIPELQAAAEEIKAQEDRDEGTKALKYFKAVQSIDRPTVIEYDISQKDIARMGANANAIMSELLQAAHDAAAVNKFVMTRIHLAHKLQGVKLRDHNQKDDVRLEDLGTALTFYNRGLASYETWVHAPAAITVTSLPDIETPALFSDRYADREEVQYDGAEARQVAAKIFSAALVWVADSLSVRTFKGLVPIDGKKDGYRIYDSNALNAMGYLVQAMAQYRAELRMKVAA